FAFRAPRRRLLLGSIRHRRFGTFAFVVGCRPAARRGGVRERLAAQPCRRAVRQAAGAAVTTHRPRRRPRRAGATGAGCRAGGGGTQRVRARTGGVPAAVVAGVVGGGVVAGAAGTATAAAHPGRVGR